MLGSLSARFPWSPQFHLCVWAASPSSGRLHVPPFTPWALPHLVARMGTSDFPWTVGFPPGLPVVPPYPLPGRSLWDLPSSRLCLGDVPRSSTPGGFAGAKASAAPLMWLSVLLSTSAPTVRFLITGLNPFTLAHCGPSPPCVRFAALVTDDDATRGTRCLAGTSGARSYPWLTKPSFARRTSNGAKTWDVSLEAL